MKVIIPLAGFGTRLRPHTFTKPKPLINVAGKPVLGHLLDKLATLDIEEYVFVVGYLGEQVEEYVKSEYKLNARFVEQNELLGQAHAIWLAKDYLHEGPVFVLFVDTLFEADLSQLSKDDCDATIFVKEVDDPRSFGVVTLNKENLISGFVEKPKTMDNRLAVVGLYYFKNAQALIAAIQEQMNRKTMTNNEYFLADAMNIMLERHAKFQTAQVSEWLDCGKPDTVLETNRYLLEHGRDNSVIFQDRRDVIIIAPVNIHPSATISHSIIGPHVTIAANCTITNSILRDTIVDTGATCKDTLIEHSLIGSNSKLEGHYRVVNVGDSSAVGYV
ncbi:MAG TPA: sugar phosphate nucleotidyltransferase [Aggregatilineales bacterium]|nr:sugar phosphate nucleotidyltransferase [Aggregatilineales bacterium]